MSWITWPGACYAFFRITTTGGRAFRMQPGFTDRRK
jgi:hypothetical protein